MKKLLLLAALLLAAWKIYPQLRPASAGADVAAAPFTPAFHAVTGALVVAEGHALVLADSGALYGWGSNGDKQLGLANAPSVTAPLRLPGPRPWRAVHSGDKASYAIDTEGALWRRSFNTWTYAGGDKSGEEMQYTPVFSAQRWRKAEEGWGIALGLDDAGALWLWSEAAFAPAPHPDPAADAAVTAQAVGGGKRFRDFCVNQGSFLAVDSDGALWQGPEAKPHQNFLQGARHGEVTPTLTVLAAPARFQRVFCRSNASHMFALDENYRLWGRGHNSFGELGDGDGDAFTPSVPATTFRPVTDRPWLDIAVGHTYSVGVAGDGTLWAWGNNAYGQLGIGNYDYQDRPAPVDTRPIWRAVSAGTTMAAALTRDGQVYVWGERNMRGARGETVSLLGDGGVAERRLKPTPVAATETWKKEH